MAVAVEPLHLVVTAHLGYQAFGWLTRGQELSLPMIVIGLGMLVWAYQRKTKIS